MTTRPDPNPTDQSSPPVVVGVVSSPSTNTQLTLDITEDEADRKLVGALVGFTSSQVDHDDLTHKEPLTAVLGQITSLQLRNRWHEDQTFKNIIKSHLQLPAITKQQDTRTAIMRVGGCFVRTPNNSYTHGDLGSVPHTGTPVNLVRQEFLDGVLKFCNKDLFYLGNAYGNNIPFPMWFKHFGKGKHGIGEAYHIGIFGKTGSGKTGLAKMLLAAYARHPDMGILVIDPQGEFSLEMHGQQIGEQSINLKNILQDNLKRTIIQKQISQLQLDDWILFEDLLNESKLLETTLRIRGQDSKLAASQIITSYLRHNFKIHQIAHPSSAYQMLQQIKRRASQIYNTSASRKELDQTITQLINDEFDSFIQNTWHPIAKLFANNQGKKPLEELIAQLVNPTQPAKKPIVVLDLSDQTGESEWSDTLQKRIISYIVKALIQESAKTFATQNTANTLVLLDEAHRFVPSGGLWNLNQQERELLNELKRAVRETRKYGIGWMFISQTMQGIDQEILMQLRAMLFGYGLALGLEFQRLTELAGGDKEAINLYRSFRDPQSAVNPEAKQFPFMAIGPISPMPFSGQPMFISAFNTQQFNTCNNLTPYKTS